MDDFLEYGNTSIFDLSVVLPEGHFDLELISPVEFRTVDLKSRQCRFRVSRSPSPVNIIRFFQADFRPPKLSSRHSAVPRCPQDYNGLGDEIYSSVDY